MDIQQLVESSNQFKVVMDDAKKLSSKWTKSGLLEGIVNENEKNTMATLLENQAKQLVTEGNVSGGTNSQAGAGYNAENWAGVALPLVRRVFGDIAAKEFVSVQPMNLPSGLVFYLDFKYGNKVAAFEVGESVYGADPQTNVTNLTSSLYEAGHFGYSLNNTSQSVLFTTSSVTGADINNDTTYATGSLRKIIVSGSLYDTVSSSFDTLAVRAFNLTNAALNINNAGVLMQFTKLSGSNNALVFITDSSLLLQPVGNSGSATGSATLSFIKATTPAARGDFEDAFGSATSSQLSQNQPISIAEINVQMKSEAIVAKTRKLKAQWTPEFAQDLNAYHSVDAEGELTGILSQYISMEIDLEILDMLIQNAYTVDYWSANNNTVWNGTSFTQASSAYYNTQGGWYQTLGTKLQKVSNKIHQLTLRGGANFMVVSPTVATIIESIPGFASDSSGDEFNFNFGIQKVGALNSRYKVYKNPYMTENVILMGYKGAQFLECGAVFAPYVPLIMTPLLYDPNTFTPRKGLMTRYAKKMIRPDYYGKVYVHGLDTI
jgi:hypothetical protein